MTKLNVACYWAASCGGCDIALLDINEQIISLLDRAEIVFWPCIMDFKYDNVRALRDESIDVCLFNGAIRSEENVLIAQLLRRKSTILVSYGSCAMMGGIPGLANLYSREALFDRESLKVEWTVSELGKAHHRDCLSRLTRRSHLQGSCRCAGDDGLGRPCCQRRGGRIRPAVAGHRQQQHDG